MGGTLVASLFFSNQHRVKLCRDFRAVLKIGRRQHYLPVEIDPRQRPQLHPGNLVNPNRFVRIRVGTAVLIPFPLDLQKNMLGLGCSAKSLFPGKTRRLSLEYLAEIRSARDVVSPWVSLKIQPEVVLIVAVESHAGVVAHSLDLQRLLGNQLKIICRQLSIQQQIVLQVL